MLGVANSRYFRFDDPCSAASYHQDAAEDPRFAATCIQP